ncbi:MAG TPA: C45 family peptidase [Candidatus Koribacter sp.]|jgi:hypothetical protein
MRLKTCAVFLLILAGTAIAASKADGKIDSSIKARLGHAYRFDRGGWVYVHLEGKPEDIGFQHGYLLAPEIEDGFKAEQISDVHASKHDWDFFRHVAHDIFWPKIDPEYQAELKGIQEGLAAKGSTITLDDVVALNGMEEIADYYVPYLNKLQGRLNPKGLVAPGNCSAFVATGSYTKDHKIVIAHNNWTSYMIGERWRIIYDIVPEHGMHFLMDGYPGTITSGDDYGINDAGLVITETTIAGFSGFDPKGVPEFMRSRKAMQYARTIDDWTKIMLEGNNGAYANDWLLADTKTNEIARVELGLEHYAVDRTKDGYFVGSNFATDPKLLKDETNFDPNDLSTSPNARRKRWQELIPEYKGQIDVELARKFMSDHEDAVSGKTGGDLHTLCGHGEVAANYDKAWEQDPFDPMGAVNGKVADWAMAKKMSFEARIGHPCGDDFKAAPFLKAHPEYDWQAPALHDMDAGPWTLFKSHDHEGAKKSQGN